GPLEPTVIDVPSLSTIDYDPVGRSVTKTGRVGIIEEGQKAPGVSAEISRHDGAARASGVRSSASNS
ncbi:MAG: transketolase C-terminal domain-containing protein, partial [Tepidisphaeraceae bacterium]